GVGFDTFKGWILGVRIRYKQQMSQKKLLWSLLSSVLIMSGCGLIGSVSSGGSDATADAIADVMVGADEILSRTTLSTQTTSPADTLGGCLAVPLSACTSDRRFVSYNGCRLGNVSLSGHSDFEYSGGAQCGLVFNSEVVRRVPNF